VVTFFHTRDMLVNWLHLWWALGLQTFEWSLVPMVIPH